MSITVVWERCLREMEGMEMDNEAQQKAKAVVAGLSDALASGACLHGIALYDQRGVGNTCPQSGGLAATVCAARASR